MIRLHHYCDICGKQMSYIDADGEVCVQGFKASQATARIAIDHLIKVLNGCRTAGEQQTADTAARDWLQSIGL